MKYYDPTTLVSLLSQISMLARSSVGQNRHLKFSLRDGKVIAGYYEGTVLGINDRGFHSLTARVTCCETDYPTPIELEEVVAVQPVTVDNPT